jgi:hypothetical protein
LAVTAEELELTRLNYDAKIDHKPSYEKMFVRQRLKAQVGCEYLWVYPTKLAHEFVLEVSED